MAGNDEVVGITGADRGRGRGATEARFCVAVLFGISEPHASQYSESAGFWS
jgi:hypothetical protein